ncbi:MAG TPA: M14 family metallopeptidase [Steroidobacteraceae bacterium]|nr:M14 family metallopeptidase [Steroidobacteraceae bacterium]
MTIAEYFSADYASARERFRSAAQRAAAATVSYLLPDHHGPDGERLTLDTARLGAADAQSALLVIAGTHGVEGLAGSGCLVGLLEDRLHEALPASCCLLLLHAINPFGFAWLRRVTEDGVDLNRNFVDFSQPLPPSEAYERLHDWLVPRQWEGEPRRAADASLAAYGQQHGMAALQSAVSGGQYTRPGGLFYGGERDTWSARMLSRVLREELPATVRRLAVLDLHTGLGPPAYGEPILDAGDAGARERALSWYGRDVRDLSAGESVSARLTGTMARGIERVRPELELTFIGLEFGTRPIMDVLTALRADHWLHTYGAGDPQAAARIRRQMREAFYNDSAAWQAAVYGRTADLAFRALRGVGSGP